MDIFMKNRKKFIIKKCMFKQLGKAENKALARIGDPEARTTSKLDNLCKTHSKLAQ
jgi:hypothetical protein